jgi:hypothetical protein
MKYLVLVFIFLSSQLWASDNPKFSKEVIESFMQIGNKLEASNASEINSILSASNFKNLQNYQIFSERVMNSVYAADLQLHLKPGMNVDALYSNEMQMSAKKASEDDTKFAIQNFEWIMKKFTRE